MMEWIAAKFTVARPAIHARIGELGYLGGEEDAGRVRVRFVSRQKPGKVAERLTSGVFDSARG